MTSPDLLLADRVLRERPRPGQFGLARNDIIGWLGHRTCERYAYDDAASYMLGLMAEQTAEKFKSLLTVAKPPCDRLWIEWNLGPLRRATVELGIYEPSADEWSEPRRFGVLAQRVDDQQTAFMFVQENDSASAGLMYWPVGYIVSTDGTKLPLLGDDDVELPRGEQDNFTRGLWGFIGEGRVAPLRGMATIFFLPGATQQRAKEELLVDVDFAQATRDLTGCLRVTIAALALLNAVGDVSGERRPPGLVRGGGELKPYVPRRLVTVQVPKHRTPLSYARSRILAHHKRLHEVRSHWRHLSHEPRAPGWERIETGGRTLWRKSIARHLRGNPDLGVIEHAGARVTGPHR